MNISSVDFSPSSIMTPASAKGAMPGVDGSEFMTIMLAQLRNQNPLEPVNDKELISQMTSLNSLQELQKINTTLESLLGAILLAPPSNEGVA